LTILGTGNDEDASFAITYPYMNNAGTAPRRTFTVNGMPGVTFGLHNGRRMTETKANFGYPKVVTADDLRKATNIYPSRVLDRSKPFVTGEMLNLKPLVAGDTLNPIVYSRGFQMIHYPASSIGGGNNRIPTQAHIDLYQPDVIQLGYNCDISVDEAIRLKNYAEAGGTIVAMLERDNGPANLANAVFGAGSGVTTSNEMASGAMFALLDVDDVIINGAFGDMRPVGGEPKYFGEDNSDPNWFNNLPPDSAIIYSYSIDAFGTDSYGTPIILGGQATPGANLWRHARLDIFFLGDGGLSTAPLNWIDLDDRRRCPYRLEPICYFPIPKNPEYSAGSGYNTGYGRNGNNNNAYRRPVYNSTIFSNVMCWAIIQAAENTLGLP